MCVKKGNKRVGARHSVRRCDVRNRAHDQNRHIRAGVTQVVHRAGSASRPVSFAHISVRTDARHGRRSTSSSILGWQMRECPLSRHLGMEAPASPRPPDAGRGFSFRLAMTVLPLLQGWYCGPRRSWFLGPHVEHTGHRGHGAWGMGHGGISQMPLWSLCFPALADTTKSLSRSPDYGPALLPYFSSTRPSPRSEGAAQSIGGESQQKRTPQRFELLRHI
jgi:hypothetical protein